MPGRNLPLLFAVRRYTNNLVSDPEDIRPTNIATQKQGKWVAGVVGFEPTVHDTKNRCLTTWLHPNGGGFYTPSHLAPQALVFKILRVFVQRLVEPPSWG